MTNSSNSSNSSLRSNGPIRVLCVDDHEFIAEGLAARIASERDLEYVGRIATANNLTAELTRLRPQVVLLDLEMPGDPPLEAMVEALRHHPETRFLVLSAQLRDVNIAGALQRGAAGCFSKSDTPAAIFAGVRRVANGAQAFGEGVAERLESMKSSKDGTAGSTRLDTLSPREIEVLRLVGRGMSRADIARSLVRSLKTIDAHHTSIMRKLDIHDRAELTRYAIREGLVEA